MAITKRGENIYLIRVYIGRHAITKKRLESNETFYGTEEEALRREQLLKDKVATGEVSKPSAMSLGQLGDLYLDTTRQYRSEASQQLMKDQFDMYVRPYLGSRKVAQIKSLDIQQYFNFLSYPKKEGKNGNQKK